MAETYQDQHKEPDPVVPKIIDPSFLNADSVWVDSVLHTLSTEEKIAQLIMIRAYSNQGIKHKEKIRNTITKYKVGGLVFFQGGPKRQAKLCNEYQAISKIPLLIAMDGEWGLGMRLDSTISYPYQMSLGAIQNDSLLLNMSKAMAKQFNRLGVHWNFAPVADINNNPKNPVINFRSFGENPLRVVEKCAHYINGMDAYKILCSVKHFPGHGDTQVDSHETLPLIKHDTTRLQNTELFPFKALIKKGLSGIMVGHLNIPALDSTTNYPTSLSPIIINDLLKGKMGFKGLVVSDAMDMRGLTNYVEKDQAEILALLAGNDIIELVEDVPAAINNIKKAIENGVLSQKLINDKCRRVLKAKYWTGLNDYAPIDTENLSLALNDSSYLPLISKLHQASFTLLNNTSNYIDSIKNKEAKILSIGIGNKQTSHFQKALKSSFGMATLVAPRFMNASQYNSMKSKINEVDFVVISLHQHLKRPGFKLGYGKYTRQLIQDIITKDKALIFCFRNPYILDQIKDIKDSNFLMVTYQDNVTVQGDAFKVIKGETSMTGRLPVSLKNWPEGAGINYPQ